MKKRKQTILAIDPGLRELGFAVMSGNRLITAGTRSFRQLPRSRRRAKARQVFGTWLNAHKPRTIVLEATYGHPVAWFDELHRLTESIVRAGRSRKIKVVRYAPQTVRKSLTGSGRATKAETAIAIVSQYPTLRVYLTQDRKWKVRYWQNMFDAIALALHHQRTH